MVELWARLNRSASLDRSPTPLLTPPPLQYALGIPVFMHMFYSALPKTRFIKVPSVVSLLHKMAKVCETCGSPVCQQEDLLVCEEAQREWLRYTKMFHGENLTPHPDDLDSTRYNNLAFHCKVLNCHPGTVFYYSLPSMMFVTARAALHLCVICGLRHATYGTKACIGRTIEVRDVASSMFLQWDIWNVTHLEEFREEEDEKQPEGGPGDLSVPSKGLRTEPVGTEESPKPATDSEARISRVSDMLKEWAQELEVEEGEVETQERDFIMRRKELELLASQIRIKRLDLKRDKERLTKAYQTYEARIGEFREDETRGWILVVMWSEVEDLCGVEF